MAIDTRQLIHLLALARCGSFSRAAESQGISQPALSKSISLLERRIGEPVVERTQSGAKLTALGDVLARRGREMEALLRETEREVSLRSEGVAGPLNVGATPSMMLTLVRDGLCRLSAEIPELCVSVTEALDDELAEQLLAWKIDIAVGPVGGLHPPPHGILEQVLFTEEFRLAVGPGNKLRRRKSASLAELADAPWVLPMPGSSYYRHVESLFRGAGVSWPTNCLSSNSLAMTEDIVMRTDRITIITALQSHEHNGIRLRSIALRGAGRRTVGVRHRRGSELPPVGRRFITILSELALRYGRARDRPAPAG